MKDQRASPSGEAEATAADHEGPSVTMAEALSTIDRATGFTEPLRRRTEGVSIALWGFVTASMLLSNGLLDGEYGFYDAGGWRRIVSSFLWVPWAGLGVLGTMAIWRIAEVSARAPRRRAPRRIIAWFAVLAGLVFVIAVVPVAASGIALATLGLIWLAIGAFDLYGATPAGRRTLIALGVTIMAAGATYGWISRGWSHEDAWRHFEAVSVLAAGVVPILAGFRLTLRG